MESNANVTHINNYNAIPTKLNTTKPVPKIKRVTLKNSNNFFKIIIKDNKGVQCTLFLKKRTKSNY